MRLTRRRLEILREFAEGGDYIEVAARLGLARPTISSHVNRMQVDYQVVGGAPALVAWAIRHGALDAHPPIPADLDLTPGQRRVLEVLGRTGGFNEQIAAELHLSTHTVKSHLRAVVARLGPVSRAGVVAAAAYLTGQMTRHGHRRG